MFSSYVIVICYLLRVWEKSSSLSYYWRPPWASIWKIPDFSFETPIFSLETLIFSLETPIFSLETLIFSLETLIFSLETLIFSLETFIFSLETPDFQWRLHIFVGEPHYFHWRPIYFHWRPSYFHWKPQIFNGDSIFLLQTHIFSLEIPFNMDIYNFLLSLKYSSLSIFHNRWIRSAYISVHRAHSLKL